MKKQLLGRQLLFAGGILIVAFACQPKETSAPSPKESPSHQNPSQDDNEDEDDDNGTYGDGDTSASCDDDCSHFLQLEEVSLESMDMKEIDETAAECVALIQEATEKAPEIIVPEVNESPSAGAVVVLEAVSPVEIVAEHQVSQTEEKSESLTTQN